MTVAAKDIIWAAQDQLKDLAGDRWPARDLVSHLNDGQRDIVVLRPDAVAKTVAHALVAGPRQVVPADCSRLIDIPRNTGGRALRQVARKLLDASDPSWYTRQGTKALQHFMLDPREPKVFWVYPPAMVGASVDVDYAPLPQDVAAPSGDGWASVAGDVNLPDDMKNALIHFVLFRAYGKDAEVGNADLAAAHFKLYKACLGDDAAARQAFKPKVGTDPSATS